MSCDGYDFDIHFDATFKRDIIYKDSTGDPLDLSALVITFKVGDVSYVSDSVQIVNGPELGYIHLMLLTAQVNELVDNSTPYKIILTNPLALEGAADLIILEGRLNRD